MSLLGFLTGSKKRNLIRNLIDDGSEIIDIRDSKEYLKAHVHGSRNIPEHLIKAKVEDLKQQKSPYILYGMDKDHAKASVELLKQHGIAAINGGNFQKMQMLSMG